MSSTPATQPPPQPGPEPDGGSSPGADEVEASRMSLGDHLHELRSRLMRAVIAVVIAFAVIYGFREPAFEMVQGPHHWAISQLNQEKADVLEQRHLEAKAASESTAAQGVTAPEREAWMEDPADPGTYFEPGYPEVKRLNSAYRLQTSLLNFAADSGFFVKMRVCFWLALFVAGPFALWEIWGFIAAGLYKHERKVIYTYFPMSLLLFVGGVLFGFFVLVPYALYFLGLDSIESRAMEVRMGVDQYLGFLKGLALALGAVFQLPVVMVALSRIGLVEPKTFAHFRKHTLVGALVIAAILTPPDPVTQLMMAGPVVLLYEAGVHLSKWAWRKQVVGPTQA